MLQLMSNIQQSLNHYQARFVAGPLIASPLKAMISTAELVAGIVGALLFGIAFLISGNRTLGEWAISSVNHMGVGLTGLIYSIANIATLGLLAYRAEAL